MVRTYILQGKNRPSKFNGNFDLYWVRKITSLNPDTCSPQLTSSYLYCVLSDPCVDYSSHALMDDRRAISGTYKIHTPIQGSELTSNQLTIQQVQCEFYPPIAMTSYLMNSHDVIMNLPYTDAPTLCPRNCNNFEQLPVTYRRGRHTHPQRCFLQSTKHEITAL